MSYSRFDTGNGHLAWNLHHAEQKFTLEPLLPRFWHAFVISVRKSEARLAQLVRMPILYVSTVLYFTVWVLFRHGPVEITDEGSTVGLLFAMHI